MALFLVISFLSIAIYLNCRLISYLRNCYVALLQRRNLEKRERLLSMIGVKKEDHSKKFIIGFMHPYCNAGGGGERVLWTAVALHQRTEPDTICAIYTGDLDVTKREMMQKVQSRFGIHLDPASLLLVPLKTRSLVEASTWPRFTLLGQSLGSLVLGYEALSALIPDLYMDTMGYAFTYPIFRLLTHIPVGAYVHYPMISIDMLKRVSRRSSAHNNSPTISQSLVLSYAKLIYYIIFAELYSLCLRQAHLLMVNSTWTKNHIDRLLKPWLHRDVVEEEEEAPSTPDGSSNLSTSDGPLRQRHGHTSRGDGRRRSASRGGKEEKRYGEATVVYPPCDVESFAEFPLESRGYTILSISQFRPEKEQATQIEAFAQMYGQLSTDDDDAPLRSHLRLVLAGSCRDPADQRRVQSLKHLAASLGVAAAVDFRVNVSWDELRQLLRDSLVGISTMVDEHFGISIVEFMAAGLIPVVHESGGPKEDIVVPMEGERTGFHATGAASYARHLAHILRDLGPADRARIQRAARRQALRKFNPRSFHDRWLAQLRHLRAHAPRNPPPPSP